jgi:transglutaminase/protease-like cytokinesis protein 3
LTLGTSFSGILLRKFKESLNKEQNQSVIPNQSPIPWKYNKRIARFNKKDKYFCLAFWVLLPIIRISAGEKLFDI